MSRKDDEREQLYNLSPASLPTNPSQAGYSAEQIKKKHYLGLYFLHDLLDEARTNSEEKMIKSFTMNLDELIITFEDDTTKSVSIENYIDSRLLPYIDASTIAEYYYKKNQTYSKEEVFTRQQVHDYFFFDVMGNYYTKKDIDEALSQIPKFKIKIVENLTDIENPSESEIYIIKTSDSQSGNLYTEYIYTSKEVDGKTIYMFEQLGTQELNLSGYYTSFQVDSKLADYVLKVSGKGLSTNDFTDSYKTKLDNIAEFANNYTPPSDMVRDSEYVHTDNNFSDTYKANVDSNTLYKHWHDNKDILDRISQSDISKWNTDYLPLNTFKEIKSGKFEVWDNVLSSLRIENYSGSIGDPTATTNINFLKRPTTGNAITQFHAGMSVSGYDDSAQDKTFVFSLYQFNLQQMFADELFVVKSLQNKTTNTIELGHRDTDDNNRSDYDLKFYGKQTNPTYNSKSIALLEDISDSLSDYYSKGSVYTKTEINNLLSTINGSISTLSDTVGNLKTIEISVVNSLPQTGESNVIYLVAKSQSATNNSYYEYVWIASGNKFEKIGDTEIDLSSYVTSTSLSTTLQDYVLVTTLDEYYTKAEIEAKGYLTSHQSLANYYTKTEINNFGFLTQHQSLSGYATESWVEAKGYITSHQSLANYFNLTQANTLQRPLTVTGGDATTAGKIILDQATAGQITSSGTQTIFGFTTNGATSLTVGHSSYSLALRGSGSRPKYNGNDMAMFSDLGDQITMTFSNGVLTITPKS